jgi:proline dehydrogenase
MFLAARRTVPSAFKQCRSYHPSSGPLSQVATLGTPTEKTGGTTTFVSPSIDFNDNATIFQKYTFPELLTSYVALASCRNPVIRNYGATFLEYGGELARIAAKFTYFKYFCGGEQLEETRKVIDQLYSKNLGVILDYSVEGSPLWENGTILTNVPENREDAITQVKMASITYMGQQNERLLGFQAPPSMNLPCPLGVVKVSSICDCNLLLRMSEILTYIRLFPKSKHTQMFLDTHFNTFNDNHNNNTSLDFNAIMKEYALEANKRTPAFHLSEDKPPEALSEAQLAKWRRVIDRVELLCKECQKTGVALLIDAEQSYLQPAIDFLSMFVTYKYNTNIPKGYSAIVHNTYQLYLKDTNDRMAFDYNFLLKYGSPYGIKQGVKLVRGAYIKSESQRSQRMNLPYPFNESIDATHASYHRGLDFALHHLSHSDTVSIVVASHNPNSIQYVVQKVHELNLFKKDSRLLFAQLYGMGHTLSLGLSNAGYNIAKLVPFGPVKEVLPYLSRRLIENGDMLGGSYAETKRMRKEIMNRILKINL